MGGFLDLLGGLLQKGMSKSTSNRMGNALGVGGASNSMTDMIGGLAGMFGGPSASPSPGGGSLGGIGGVVGEVLGGLGQNKAAVSGIGALIGALIGGGQRSALGAIGGGGLAMLASLALSALKKAGQKPTMMPSGLVEPQEPKDFQARDEEAKILIKAMICAAKADGKIDEQEAQKILGKLQEDGLTEAEKQWFLKEVQKPLDISELVAFAQGRPEIGAQIYAASLLAIEVDTPAEREYLQTLAQELQLDPEVVNHIHQALGV